MLSVCAVAVLQTIAVGLLGDTCLPCLLLHAAAPSLPNVTNTNVQAAPYVYTLSAESVRGLVPPPLSALLKSLAAILTRYFTSFVNR